MHDLLLYTGVRVEWSKALARKERWAEEETRLKEEMRKVLRYLDHEAKIWRARVSEGSMQNISRPVAAIQAGMRAYAARQADMRHNLVRSFQKQWRNHG